MCVCGGSVGVFISPDPSPRPGVQGGFLLLRRLSLLLREPLPLLTAASLTKPCSFTELCSSL